MSILKSIFWNAQIPLSYGIYSQWKRRINIGQAQAEANLYLRPETMAQPVFMEKIEIAKLDPSPAGICK